MSDIKEQLNVGNQISLFTAKVNPGSPFGSVIMPLPSSCCSLDENNSTCCVKSSIRTLSTVFGCSDESQYSIYHHTNCLPLLVIILWYSSLIPSDFYFPNNLFNCLMSLPTYYSVEFLIKPFLI